MRPDERPMAARVHVRVGDPGGVHSLIFYRMILPFDTLAVAAQCAELDAWAMRLDERILCMGEIRGGVELAGRHGEEGPQAAVAVDAKRLVMLAAVGEAALAGIARLAIVAAPDALRSAELETRLPR